MPVRAGGWHGRLRCLHTPPLPLCPCTGSTALLLLFVLLVLLLNAPPPPPAPLHRRRRRRHKYCGSHGTPSPQAAQPRPIRVGELSAVAVQLPVLPASTQCPINAAGNAGGSEPQHAASTMRQPVAQRTRVQDGTGRAVLPAIAQCFASPLPFVLPYTMPRT